MAERSQNHRAEREQVKPYFHDSNQQCFVAGMLSNATELLMDLSFAAAKVGPPGIVA